jgi:hypothetical protein
MALAGVSDVYSKSNDLLNTFLGIDISASQVYRVTDCWGQLVAPSLLEEVQQPKLEDNLRVYASIDGSMIQMDEKWQEAKLGRIYREDSRTENGVSGENEVRYKLTESTYSAHLGAHTEFIPKFEASLGTYKNHKKQLVFITDGAVWIQKYLTQRFPESTHILDYFHAVEHLAGFAKIHFKDTNKRQVWLGKQQTELLEGTCQSVINNINKLRNLRQEAKKVRTQLVDYYQNNLSRMEYKRFRDQNLSIGSGPMEAAHRTVIQTRMKRSGQRWTPNGAQAMLNLRVLSQSQRWNAVTNFFKNAA